MERKTKMLIDANCILGNSIRFQLVKLLLKEKLQISGIAERLGVERNLVCYHLGKLEEHGFIKREYQIIRKPKNGHGLVGMFFEVSTEKVDQAMADVQDFLNDLKRRLECQEGKA